ncbi:MAG: cbb3-type cytochrome c oxidase subunit II [Planctomycetes bacterium]|nr:cbb3-type cytochrome c oxidase subunit II [Planctomycetota bacterium]
MSAQVPLSFVELKEQYPDAFKKAYGDKPIEAALAEALEVGHKSYVGEACWHCHSQQVRPWGGDEATYGRVSFPEEYHNKLNMPPLWGTRRIGPDLIREAGKHSNDWHVAHFFHPRDVVPTSVMPDYPWFYEADGLTPNKTGLSVIAYIQWLGSWLPAHPETIQGVGAIERAYPEPKFDRPIAAPAPAASPASQPAAEEENGGY